MSASHTPIVERLRQPDLWVAVRNGTSETIDGAPVEAADTITELLEALEELDALREGCSPDELGAVFGKRVAAFVELYRAAIAKARGEA